MTTIKWTTKSHKAITATPSDKMPQTWLHVTVDGKDIGSGYLTSVADERVAAVAKQLTAAGLTHVLVCGKTPIGVPADVATQIAAAQAEVANRPESLESQRESLVAAVLGAGDECREASERALGYDTGEEWDKIAQADAAIKAAEQSLAEFDTAHPEIAAKIEAERREAKERFLRAN